MKNNFEYSVDEIHYFSYETKSLILFCGWCFHASQAPLQYHVNINGSEVECKVGLVDRIDIVQQYLGQTNGLDVGFFVSALVEGDIHSAELTVSCHRDTVHLQKIKEKTLQSIKREGPVCYRIGGYIPSDGLNKHIHLNDGWAFAFDGSTIEFGVENNKHQLIESNFRILDIDAFYQMGLLNDSNKHCFFHLSFKDDGDSPYYLTFYNDHIHQSVEINESILSQSLHTWYSYLSKINPDLIHKGYRYLKDNGVKNLFRKIVKGEGPDALDYNNWTRHFDCTKEELEKQLSHQFAYTPKMSFIVATFNTPVVFLKEMIDAVANQTYPNWELCIADGSSSSVVMDYIRDHYQDERIKTVSLDKNYGIAGNMNQAIQIATGDYIGLYDHDDTVTPNALFEFVKVLNEHPEVKMIYSDEDNINTNGTLRMRPHFKSDFNPDLLRTNNYICHLLFVKSNLVKELGGLRSEFDGAQDFDFVLRLMDILKPSEIYHVPKVLYHWRIHENSTAGNPDSKSYAFDAGKKAVAAYHERNHVDAEIVNLQQQGYYRSIYHIKSHPKVSIVVYNTDHIENLKRCIESVENNSGYDNYEIILIDNNSQKEETFEFYQKLESTYANLRIEYWKKADNYSSINNYGAQFATGDYYIFLDNNVQVFESSWIETMLGYCMRKDVGIVGAKLLYPDDTIHHAGLLLRVEDVVGRAFYKFSNHSPGYAGRLMASQDLSAVSGECMMVKASVFNQLGGFDCDFQTSFNDVDFCLRVRDKGCLVVFASDCQLYYLGSTLQDGKMKYNQADLSLFRERWNSILQKGDPYYNPNLTVTKTDYSIKEY